MFKIDRLQLITTILNVPKNVIPTKKALKELRVWARETDTKIGK